MRDLGEFLKKDKKIDFYSSVNDALLDNPSNKYDIVNTSFIFEELKSPEERTTTLNYLWELVADEGYMFIVLPGSPLGFRFLNDL